MGQKKAIAARGQVTPLLNVFARYHVVRMLIIGHPAMMLKTNPHGTQIGRTLPTL